MDNLRWQLAEILNGTLDSGGGLLSVSASSENTEGQLPPKLAEGFLRPIEKIRRLEACLIRVAGINPERIEPQLVDGQLRQIELADILQRAAGDLPIESLATLRATVIVDRYPIIRRYLEVVCSRPAITRAENSCPISRLNNSPKGRIADTGESRVGIPFPLFRRRQASRRHPAHFLAGSDSSEKACYVGTARYQQGRLRSARAGLGFRKA